MNRSLMALGMGVVLACGLPASAQSSAQPQVAPGVAVERINKLMVGDRAPKMEVGRWVQGTEVTGFEKGRVYVVEFWATWCGPCIKGMPHVSKLQKEYKDKGVQVIGVNIWDDPANVDPFMESRGSTLMSYTVAVEEKIEGQNVRYGKMATGWMKAAGRNGIPSAFIVDKAGYVAWMGHPMSMDEPLKQIVAGEWDLAKAAKDHAEKAKIDKLYNDFSMAVRTGDAKVAAMTAEQLIDTPVGENAAQLNSIAWAFVDPDGKFAGKHTDLALKIATRAADLSDRKDPAILDTLAWALYHAGDIESALQTEQTALGLADEDSKQGYEDAIERMKGGA